MIANALRVEIEKFASTRCRKNPLFVMAEEGRIGRSCIRSYLQNIHYLVSYTPTCLRRAVIRANEVGDAALSAHFVNKLSEETGHDVWAERDLASVTESSTNLSPEVTAGMRSLVSYVCETIEKNPSLYLSYILFAEYFTVVLGPEWLMLLEERCGIPRSSMSVVANHVELDVDHVEHALNEIDDLVGDPARLPQMREVLLESMARFEQFCTDLAVAHEQDNERIKHLADSHVSAA